MDSKTLKDISLEEFYKNEVIDKSNSILKVFTLIISPLCLSMIFVDRNDFPEVGHLLTNRLALFFIMILIFCLSRMKSMRNHMPLLATLTMGALIFHTTIQCLLLNNLAVIHSAILFSIILISFLSKSRTSVVAILYLMNWLLFLGVNIAQNVDQSDLNFRGGVIQIFIYSLIGLFFQHSLRKQHFLDVKNRYILAKTKHELLVQAHKAGMADIATTILHTVGNVLANAKTNTTVLEENLYGGFAKLYSKANTILRENMDNLDQFIIHDPKGKHLMEYYLSLEKRVQEEQETQLKYINNLKDNISQLNEIIISQKSFATQEKFLEKITIEELIDTVIGIQESFLIQNNIEVKCNYQSDKLVMVQKSKLAYVILNLISNAQNAIIESKTNNRVIHISTNLSNNILIISVRDEGKGIKKELQTKIFTQGYINELGARSGTLHNCANYITEMDGKLKVESNGINTGSTFTIELPVGGES